MGPSPREKAAQPARFPVRVSNCNVHPFPFTQARPVRESGNLPSCDYQSPFLCPVVERNPCDPARLEVLSLKLQECHFMSFRGFLGLDSDVLCSEDRVEGEISYPMGNLRGARVPEKKFLKPSGHL